MQNQDFDFGSTTNVATDDRDFEQISYGKFAYKRVQRLRRKGRRRGIEVPRLGYELTKPEKPRILFLITTIISAIIFAAILIGTGFLYNELVKLYLNLDGIGELFSTFFDPQIFVASAGLSALPGIMIGIIYLFIFLLFLLPIGVALYFYRFLRDTYYMSKCSLEEFAKGSLISDRIFRFIAILLGVTVLFIVLMVMLDAPTAKVYLGLFYAGVVVVFGGMLAILIIEKTKCKQWFETLDEEKKQNYLAHENGLKAVKRHLNSEKRFWQNLGK